MATKEQEEVQNEGAAEDSAAMEDQHTDNNSAAEEAPAEEEKEEKEEELTAEQALEVKLSEVNDKYLRIYSEFENYRKRTQKEKLDLLRTAAADTVTNLLPVLDDFERAIQSNESSEDLESIKEGIKLVHQKLHNTLKQAGLAEIDSMGKEFDLDLHEALTKIPAPEKDLKGKVVDVIEKGYYLNEKVIRYAKVVVGE